METMEAQISRLSRSSSHGLFNLILYATNPQRLKYLQDFIQTIVKSFPCRTILIYCDPEAPAKQLELQETTNATYSQIQINSSSEQLHRVPFVIFPILIPDLPLYLFWTEDPTREEIVLPRLIKFSKRLFFEYGNINERAAFSLRLLQMMHAHPEIEFIDLNWSINSGWRHLLPQVFDSADKIEQLRNAKTIKISYSHQPAQAVYLISWLASRLEWKSLASKPVGDGTEWLLQGPNEQIKVNICSGYQAANTGVVTALEVASSDGFTCNLTPNSTLSKIIVHIASNEICDLPFSLLLRSLKQPFPYLNEWLFSTPTDHYRNMLSWISTHAPHRLEAKADIYHRVHRDHRED